ncbi:hypothetical protein Tco_1316887 [Tanacetum coccineum]
MIILTILWVMDDYVIGDGCNLQGILCGRSGPFINFVSSGQFCDSDLGRLLSGKAFVIMFMILDRCRITLRVPFGPNLYTISVEDMMKSSPICLLSKASKNKSWLWHRRLKPLEQPVLSMILQGKKALARGLPRLEGYPYRILSGVLPTAGVAIRGKLIASLVWGNHIPDPANHTPTSLNMSGNGMTLILLITSWETLQDPGTGLVAKGFHQEEGLDFEAILRLPVVVLKQ